MKLNTRKTKTMIVSRSRTMHSQSPALTNGGIMLKESVDLDTVGVTLIHWERLLGSIHAWFPEQLLKGLVSLESPGE